MDLSKCFENDDFIYFHKKSNKNHYFYRGEKHKKRVWRLKSIKLDEFLEAIKSTK